MIAKYFKRCELCSKDGAKSPFPCEVRPELLALLDKIRECFGAPIVVNSAYRSPGHNRAVGGVENSYHVQGLAADIRPLDMNRLQELQDLCKRVNHDGGVGVYKTFVHVDARGWRARWIG